MTTQQATGETYPTLRSVVLDAEDARALAEFYRQLLGLHYRPGHEPPPAGEPDTQAREWLVLRGAGLALAFQPVARLPRATWPEGEHPQQLHLDMTVSSRSELLEQHRRALTLGAHLLRDLSDDFDEPLYVYADPEGHPFCIFVWAG